MDCCRLPISISIAACAIAEQIQNDEDLILLAAVFTQLGDTLATIVTQREQCRPDDTSKNVGINGI